MSIIEARGSSSKKEELLYLFSGLGLMTISLLLLSGSAFTYEAKKEMLIRDNRRCVECDSEINLEASHYNHDKSKGNYDDISNGRILCTRCHLKDHIENRGKNGLTKDANNWAIERLKERVSKQEAQERKDV
jgi:hypothetical protein